ncbi:hypothetical protein OE88DRAFT_725240 [Heliocybe sulcata]|uniref:Uncharacterized protein n=1 Tax=Heliocybe sulcata TaxID=5364 RepID=A0A5C3NFT9_9AGAM|nr:hypothetical protein OE88DRAFT_725240 [Heliocybe sulcata]
MNSLQELHAPKRTSITQLLNPVASGPTVESSSYADHAQLPTFNAPGHPPSQHHGHAYRGQSQSSSASSLSYSLRAANWEQTQQSVEEESPERPRTQTEHGPPQGSPQRGGEPQMAFGMMPWPQPPGNLTADTQAAYVPMIPQQMFSDERTPTQGDQAAKNMFMHQAIPQAAMAFAGPPGTVLVSADSQWPWTPGHTGVYQPSERASVRLAARASVEQDPTSQARVPQASWVVPYSGWVMAVPYTMQAPIATTPMAAQPPPQAQKRPTSDSDEQDQRPAKSKKGKGKSSATDSPGEHFPARISCSKGQAVHLK